MKRKRLKQQPSLKPTQSQSRGYKFFDFKESALGLGGIQPHGPHVFYQLANANLVGSLWGGKGGGYYRRARDMSHSLKLQPS